MLPPRCAGWSTKGQARSSALGVKAMRDRDPAAGRDAPPDNVPAAGARFAPPKPVTTSGVHAAVALQERANPPRVLISGRPSKKLEELSSVFSGMGSLVVRTAKQDSLARAAGRFDLLVLVVDGSGGRLPAIIASVRRTAPRSAAGIIAVVGEKDPAIEAPALEAGADDVLEVTTPSAVLSARVRVVLEHLDPMGELSLAPVLELRAREHLLLVHGRQIALSGIECSLLEPLFESPGQVCEREEMRRRAWGPGARPPKDGQTDLVESHLSRIRGRMGKALGWRLEPVTGVGYRVLAG